MYISSEHFTLVHLYTQFVYIVYVILLHCGASVTITNSSHVKTCLAIKLFLILIRLLVMYLV